jgi:hypothetical protein
MHKRPPYFTDPLEARVNRFLARAEIASEQLRLDAEVNRARGQAACPVVSTVPTPISRQKRKP